MEIQVNQDGKKPNDIARGPLGDTCAKKGRNRGISTVDRIALVAMFSVAILVLAMLGLTGESATQVMSAATTISNSSHIGLRVSKPGRRIPTMTTTAAKD
jgi:hypothetical protein